MPKGVEVQVLSSAYETEKNPRVFGDFVFIAQILRFPSKTFKVAQSMIKLQQVTAPSALASSLTSTVTT